MKTYGIALALGLLLVVANYWWIGQRPDVAASRACLVLLGAGPVVLALLVAASVVAMVPAAPAAVAMAAPAPKPVEPPEHTALRLLATLQEEGRLVDFFSEDITPYSDEQVGAATRGIHETCKKALRGIVTIEPILVGNEGATVTVPAGFDPGAIRVVGNVTGIPPFTGVLRHGGWRVKAVNLPARSGVDPNVIAPAEVEIG